MQKEYKVGEEIKLGNVTLVVEELDVFDCDECFFHIICYNNLFNKVKSMVGECNPYNRDDKKNVMFIELNEE